MRNLKGIMRSLHNNYTQIIGNLKVLSFEDFLVTVFGLYCICLPIAFRGLID